MYENEKKELSTKEKAKKFFSEYGGFILAGFGVLFIAGVAVDAHATSRCARRFASTVAMGHDAGVLKFDPWELTNFMSGLTPKQLDVFWKENYKTWNG